ncbi:MAG: hypothetical protein A3H98_11755 [Bacteroidetes bacterium RIFCSPLOWO2_02_FULL_36_8]|nr:MAG: hypothetical protein A3H98_11755 [Bacteroidetes bacterium RIFCSPLOWO2_02_FULL_36_8]OFY71549.1 MAG: hypothetical protein A3G23_04710 [Bacteroidetes bacterium RIFCSPLOWO2_12_FULL_37_12]
MQQKNYFLLALYFTTRFIFPNFCSGQEASKNTAEVRGFVYEEKKREPVIFTNVYLEGTNFGASTDVNGYFSITKLPAGKYVLAVSYIGFDTLRTNIQLSDGQKLTKQLFLKERIEELESVEIFGNKINKAVEVRTSVSSISAREISQLPSVGGTPDIAQFVQTLPGVVFSGDQGGKLYIRGGAPIQNKVLLDGMTIFNPFHSIGLFSVFDIDAVRNIDVYTGGFNAEYGGRISAIMDIRTRDGNKNNLSGNFSMSPFTSKLMLEGPIFKSVPGEYSSSFILSGRTSYLDKTSKSFYRYANKDGLPYHFNDLYGKATFAAAGGSKFSVFGFNFSDDVLFDSPLNLSWNNKGFGSNFIILPDENSVVINGNFSFSDYRIDLGEKSYQPKNSEISAFNMAFDFTYFIGKNEMKYGVDLTGLHTNFNTFTINGLKFNQENYSAEIGSFITYKIISGNLVFEPGIRGQFYHSYMHMNIEPRLGLKYSFTSDFRIKAAGGRFSQSIIGTDTDRDVVNLFTGYLSETEDLDDIDGKKVDSKLQTANHFVAGFEYDFLDNFEFNLEGYLKDYDQLVHVRRDRLYESQSVFITETGIAKGIDFYVKYDHNRKYAWVGYSLGFVERNDGKMTYFPNYDRRHSVNLITAYKFGKNNRWEVSARWNYGSGFPFTRTKGIYEQLEYYSGIGGDWWKENGNLGIQYEELNGGRLPSYHRLDVLIKRKFIFSKYNILEVNAGATNVYNRENIFYFDRIRYERVNQLPIMPNVGLVWNF